jgi:hypothetical protein
MIRPNVDTTTTLRTIRWLRVFAFAILGSFPLTILAQDALVASIEPVEPPSLITPVESFSPSAETNASLPVSAETTGHSPVTDSSGIPRRFHYQLGLSVRSVYDDNINLSQANRIADFYTAIEPSIVLGVGDKGQQENYLGLAYTASLFLFADHTEDNALQHLVRMEGQYRINRLTLNLSQVVQIIDGTDVSVANAAGGFDQRVNLDVAGRTRANIYTTHLAAAYDLTGKTFLSAGADYSATDYDTLIGSDVVSANLFLNYNYSPKLVVGVGGIAGYNRVDAPSPDQSFEQVNARLSYQVTGKIDLAASCGVEFRDFEDQGQSQHVSPVFELGLNYLPFDGTRVSIAANRGTQNSAVLAGQDYATTNFTATVQQRLFSRFYLTLSAGYQNSDYFSAEANGTSNRGDDYYFIEPAVSARITRYWTAGAYYQHRENSSSLDAFSFYDNQVGFRTSLEF